MIANRLDVRTIEYKEIKYEKEIGEGGFSKVFQVTTSLYKKQLLALKSPKDCKSSFENEGRLLTSLNKEESKEERKYIIHLLAFVKFKDNVFGLLTSLYGTDLSSVVKATPQGLSIEKTLRIAKQLLEVASFLKRQKVIHRDIKLPNIFMRGDELRLGDFGLAIQSTENKSGIKGKPGTSELLSPEIVTWKEKVGAPYGFSSDMWAIGCSVYSMLTQRDLFEWNSILKYHKLTFDQLELFSGPNTLEKRIEKIGSKKLPEEMGSLPQILTGMLQLVPERRVTPEAGLELISRSQSPKVIDTVGLAGQKRIREEDEELFPLKRRSIEGDRT